MLRCIILALLVLSPVPVLAQTVEGRVVSEAGDVIVGAYVTLAGSGEARTAATMTNQEGWFRLAPGSSGSFTARFEMLGYETVEMDIALGRDERRVIEVVMRPSALAVEGLVVQASGQCGPGGVSVAQAVQVWEELEKAFRAVAWTEDAEVLSYRTERWVRTLDPDELRVVEEQRERRVGFHSGAAFATAAPEELSENGFIAGEIGDEEIIFYAPDAEILMSTAFEDAHCISFDGAKLPDTLGVRFDPKDPNRGLAGTVWTRASNFAPLAVEYTYPRLPWPVQASEEQVGGRIEFSQLPEGQWVVTRWWVRTPIVEREVFPSPLRAATDSRLRIAAVREEGAHVLEVRTAKNERLEMDLASVSGLLTYEDGGAPVADATIGLAGTYLRTRSDSLGRFSLDDVPAGRYDLVVNTPAYERYDLAPHTSPVEVTGGTDEVLAVAVPTADADVAYAAALIVTVRDPGGQPLEGARVAIAPMQRTSVTDAQGRATFPRVELGRVEVAIEHLAYISRTDTIELSAEGTTMVEVPLADRVFELDEIAVTVLNPTDAKNLRRGSSASLSISAADIERAMTEGAANDIGDVLRSMVGAGVRVRPWMSDSGRLGLCVESNRTVITPSTMGVGCRMVQVVLDGGRLGAEEGATILTTLALGDVRSIEFLSPTDATFRFGTGNQWGALLIRTR